MEKTDSNHIVTPDHFYIQAERFLDIVSKLAKLSEVEAEQQQLITFHDDGSVTFSDRLFNELSKPENQDLLPWAQLHAKELF